MFTGMYLVSMNVTPKTNCTNRYTHVPEQVGEQACLMGGGWHPTAHEHGGGQHNVGDSVEVGEQHDSVASVCQPGLFDKDKVVGGGVVVGGVVV